MGQNTKVVTAFSFWDFCTEVEQLIVDGYRFSSDNDKMPSAYVGNYSCVMVQITREVQTKVEETTQETTQEATTQEATAEVKQPATRGRKPKN